MKRLTTVLFALLLFVGSLGAQTKWAIKTNLLHDATGSMNLAAEIAFTPKWSLEFGLSGNMWASKEISLQHAIFQPEARYWFCEAYSGLFLAGYLQGGVTTLYGLYDFSPYNSRYPNLKDYQLRDALLLGVGAGIGYDFILNRHWNLELELGLGYLYTKGDECLNKDVVLLKGSEFDYFGPSKLAVSIVYLF